MFVRLARPSVHTSFIKSISSVISSFLAFRLGRRSLPSRMRKEAAVWDNASSVLLSRGDSTTREALVNVYGCSIASRNCRSLSLRAKCSDNPSEMRPFSKAFYCRCESNAFAEYFRSYEMRVENRSRRGKSVLSPGSKILLLFLSFCSISVSGPSPILFFFVFLRYKYLYVQDLVLFLRLHFLFPWSSRSFFRSFCHFHLLVDISSFSPSYLHPFQFRPLFVLFFIAISVDAAAPEHGILFSSQSAHHFST